MKQKMRKVASALLLLLLIAAAGCAGPAVGGPDNGDPSADDTPYVLYFADADARPEDRSPFTGFGVSVDRTGPVPLDPEDRIRYLLEELAKGPLPGEDGLAAVMPPDTSVLSVRVEDGTAEVDLSAEAYAGEGEWDRPGLAFMDSVILTLTQASDVVLVGLTVEGQPWDDGCFLWDRPIGQFEILPSS